MSKIWEKICQACDLIQNNGIDVILEKEAELQQLINDEDSKTFGEGKENRGKRITSQTLVNKMMRDKDEKIATMVYSRLRTIEKYKQAGFLPPSFAAEAKELYLILFKFGGRMSVRYVKMPKEWSALGLTAGVLEDLVVVLRTPQQIGLGNKHMFTEQELVHGFKKFMSEEEGHPRFMFLSNLMNSANAEDLLKVAVRTQGKSNRIGVHEENYITYYYAIQGIMGDIDFDDRVTRVLSVGGSKIPPYAVHFTKANLAKAIWNKEETSSTRLRPDGKPILPGHICRFDRPVHALTNITLTNGKYHIVNADKDLRTRMAHGIKEDTERPKYQAGLVIDVNKLLNILPAGSVRMNEIGTLLVSSDIPHDCLLYCIENEKDVEFFWTNKQNPTSI